MSQPHVVVLSGSLGAGSRCDRLAVWCAEESIRRGATAALLRGDDLELPFYRYGAPQGPGAVRLRRELERADGVVLVSPSYHGSLSGLLKNALDYVNDLAACDRPFLDGRAVGCVALAAGAQGASATLAAMRTIVHALRGWPTPLGVATHGALDAPSCAELTGDEAERRQLAIVVEQVVTFARLQRTSRTLRREGHAPVPVLAAANGASVTSLP